MTAKKTNSTDKLKIGGFSEPMSGLDMEGRDITVALGWGTNQDFTMAELGCDRSPDEFMGTPTDERIVVLYLKAYTAYYINQLMKQNAALKPLDDITSKLVDDVEKLTPNNVMPEPIANALIKYFYNNENIPNDSLDDVTYERLKQAVRVIIDIAKSTDRADSKTHANLVTAAYAIHPIMSRDYRTINLGFELREYVSYFADYSASKRLQLASKMLRDWEEAGYIDHTTNQEN
jgi:hypothetical protein